MKVSSLPLSLLLVLPLSLSNAAETGTWQINGLTGSSRLIETYMDISTFVTREGEDSFDFATAGEQIVDTRFPGEIGSLELNVSLSSGAITGDLAGTYALGTQGRITLTFNDEPNDPLLGYLNLSQDTLIMPLFDSDEMEFNVGTREPATLAVADLEGSWEVVTLSIPDDITEVYYNSQTFGTREAAGSTNFAGQNEELVDVFFSSNPFAQSFSIDISALGVISGDLTGTSSVDSINKTVTLNLDGEGALIFSPNAGVNLITRVRSDGDEFETILAIKKKTTVTFADLEGTWRWQMFEVPARLREAYYNSQTDQTRTSDDSDDSAGANETLVDVYFSGHPDTDNGLVSIDGSGNVTGSDPGTLSISGDTITYTPDEQGEPGLDLHVNELGEIMVNVEVTEDLLTLLTLVKVDSDTAESLEELVDIQLDPQAGGDVDFTWNESTKFRLQKSTTLGGWDAVDGTSGQGSYSDSSQTSSGFYRIQVVDEESAD